MKIIGRTHIVKRIGPEDCEVFRQAGGVGFGGGGGGKKLLPTASRRQEDRK